MILHNYFTKQYCQTNVKQEEKRLCYTTLRGRIRTNKWNYDTKSWDHMAQYLTGWWWWWWL